MLAICQCDPSGSITADSDALNGGSPPNGDPKCYQTCPEGLQDPHQAVRPQVGCPRHQNRLWRTKFAQRVQHLPDRGIVAADASGELAVTPGAGAPFTIGQVGIRVQLAARKECTNIPATALHRLAALQQRHRQPRLRHLQRREQASRPAAHNHHGVPLGHCIGAAGKPATAQLLQPSRWLGPHGAGSEARVALGVPYTSFHKRISIHIDTIDPVQLLLSRVETLAHYRYCFCRYVRGLSALQLVPQVLPQSQVGCEIILAQIFGLRDADVMYSVSQRRRLSGLLGLLHHRAGSPPATAGGATTANAPTASWTSATRCPPRPDCLLLCKFQA
mmetsp:Transcript_6389/g.18410  ORF Transcript_6389/g.18410 Transcript_6389/m.18410 type:complete len:332 (-) Transcript_6389:504-1499(-)